MTRLVTHSVKVGLAIVATALGVASCGGDGETDESAAAGPSGGIASVASVEGSDVLVDSGGRTLYTTPVERNGKILCVEACTSFWEPVVASPDEAESLSGDLEANLGVVDRPDGDGQLTFNGLPLYTFAEEGAGQLEGDGFVDDFQGTHFEWEAARVSSSGSQGADPASNGPGGYDY